LNQAVQQKEKERAAINAKIDDEATIGGKYAKQVKELQSRLEELDEELVIERASRYLCIFLNSSTLNRLQNQPEASVTLGQHQNTFHLIRKFISDLHLLKPLC